MVAVVARHVEKSEPFSAGERAHPTNERNKLENSVCVSRPGKRQIAGLLADGVRLSEIIHSKQ
jgi:hypothetical protein